VAGADEWLASWILVHSKLDNCLARSLRSNSWCSTGAWNDAHDQHLLDFFSWQKARHWRRFALMLLLALTLLAWMMLIIRTLANLDAWSF
jgi:hypothetical protein